MRFSLVVYVVIIVLSIMITGSVLLVYTSHTYTQKVEQEISEKAELMKILQELQQRLTQESASDQSRFDPVWEYIDSVEAEQEEIEISLRDVSSRFLINTVNADVLDDAGFFSSLDTTKAVFEVFRSELGFAHDLSEAYQSVFSEEILDRYFSTFGLININHASEIMLEKLYEMHNPHTEDTQYFRAQIHQARKDTQRFSADDIKQLISYEYETLRKLLTTEPTMNVNYISEEVLNVLLSYPYSDLSIDDPSEMVDRIIADREVHEINHEQLMELFHVEDAESLLFLYLGTRTWVWEVKIQLTGRELRSVFLYDRGNDSYEMVELAWN